MYAVPAERPVLLYTRAVSLEGMCHLSRNMLVTAVAAIGAAFFIAFGLWAFIDARSFFDQMAHFDPYNAHFVHDIGAFQVGIGATLAVALWRRSDALLAALAGAGIGSTFHLVAHIQDKHLGGKDTDVFVFAAVAILLLVAAGSRLARIQR